MRSLETARIQTFQGLYHVLVTIRISIAVMTLAYDMVEFVVGLLHLMPGSGEGEQGFARLRFSTG